MRTIAHIRRRLASQRGFTLVELLVAMGVGMIVVLAAMSLMDGAQGQTSRITGRVEGTQRGRVAMEQVTQRLRSQVCLGSAAPITDAQSTEVTFFADFGDEAFTPEKRRLYVTGGVLKEDFWTGTGTPPNVTFPATPTRTRTVISGIDQARNAAGVPQPYFSYYAYNASTPTEPTEQLPTPVSTDNRARLVRVQAAFRVRVKGQDERVDTSFVNSVIVRMANPTDPEQDKRGPQCQY